MSGWFSVVGKEKTYVDEGMRCLQGTFEEEPGMRFRPL